MLYTYNIHIEWNLKIKIHSQFSIYSIQRMSAWFCATLHTYIGLGYRNMNGGIAHTCIDLTKHNHLYYTG